MKHLMTLMALVVAVTAGAQGTTIYEYPWNPDSNNDNLIGVDDLLDFLPVFGDEFGNPPEPCDYDGTPLEEFFFNALEGTVIIDSIFLEFEIENTFQYYMVGCPDPVTDTVIYSDAVTLTNFYLGSSTSSSFFTLNDGEYVQFEFIAGSNGLYNVYLINQFIADNFDYAIFEGQMSVVQADLPFPDSWIFDENGLQFESWANWAGYANYLHILPYWHYAE